MAWHQQMSYLMAVFRAEALPKSADRLPRADHLSHSLLFPASRNRALHVHGSTFKMRCPRNRRQRQASYSSDCCGFAPNRRHLIRRTRQQTKLHDLPSLPPKRQPSIMVEEATIHAKKHGAWILPHRCYLGVRVDCYEIRTSARRAKTIAP